METRKARTTMAKKSNERTRDGMEAREVLARLSRREPRYAVAAYLFLLSALQGCMERLDRPRHVTGAELADAVRELALQRFGPLARTVLEHWGITCTSDLGEIVFLMVDSGVLIKQPTDSREDFEELYSFEQAFEADYPWGALEGETFA